MISVILYGRNDSHGYNLHKRAAISLNAISEVLSPAAGDEIIFVDYNTPDDMPTFPEAISDTLSDKTKNLLRILRIRSDIHARYASRTHLNALESIARNAAIRRSSPNNRWVLSTNTDIVLTLENGAASLSEVLAGLPDGFYQLPRFEAPETLWESLNRSDGAEIVSKVKDWARRFHLDEIVYGSEEVLYDAPGDFQLALRSDLLRYYGFHEGMLWGWHVDANLSARMRLAYGEIRTLADKVSAYHCDHTRQASLLHNQDRAENDLELYGRNLNSPAIAEQAAHWGLANDELEEIRLGRQDTSAQYLRVLAKVIPEGQIGMYESAYRPDSFGDLRYPFRHVLPFVLDYLTTAPRNARIFYAGSRTDMAEKVLLAMSELGFPPAIIPEEFDWLPSENAERLPLHEAVSVADLLVFEFGTGEPDTSLDRSPEDCRRLRAIRRALIATGESERARAAGGRRRRLAAINVVHNEFETLVSSLIAPTLTPFGTRIRHGYLTTGPQPAQAFDVRSVWGDVQRATGRSASIALPEQQDLARVARASVAAGDDVPLTEIAKISAEPLLALLRHANVSQVVGITRSEAASLAERLERERPSVALLRRLPALRSQIDLADEPDALSHVADLAAWDNADFSEFVVRHFGGQNSLSLPERNIWLWERAMALTVLRRAGLLHQKARILLVVTQSEMMADVLADYVGVVDVASPVFADEQVSFARADGTHSSDQNGYDAVVCLQRALFARGKAPAPAFLHAMRQFLKADGLLLLSSAIVLSRYGIDDGFLLGRLRGGAFAEALVENNTGLRFCGPPAARLSRSTLDRSLPIERADLRYRAMVAAEPYHVWTEGLLAFRKKEFGEPIDDHVQIEGLRRALAVGFGSPPDLDADLRSRRDRALVKLGRAAARDPQYAVERTEDPYWMRRLHAASGVKADPEGFVIPAGFSGDALFGPYRVLPTGGWRLSFHLSADSERSERPTFQVEVTQGGNVIDTRVLNENEVDGREVTLDFVTPTGMLFAQSRHRQALLVETRFRPLTPHAWRISDIRLTPL